MNTGTMVDVMPVNELLGLQDKRVLVTGASGHIGRGIAMRLAEAGAAIVVHYCDNETGASNTVREIVAADGVAVAVQADLTTASGVAKLFRDIDASGAPLDGVVNNAATQPVQALQEIDETDWDKVMKVNLAAAFLVSKAAAGRMSESGVAGAVVNIASIEGSDAAPGHGHYATSKAALIMLTRACALEFGSAGIRFNSVSPGLINRAGLAENWPEGVDRWLAKAPLGCVGTPSDVADAVLFLVSPAARWITGSNLIVDGGMSVASRW